MNSNVESLSILPGNFCYRRLFETARPSITAALHPGVIFSTLFGWKKIQNWELVKLTQMPQSAGRSLLK